MDQPATTSSTTGDTLVDSISWGDFIKMGISRDYGVLVVLPIVLTLLWILIWKKGGGKELLNAIMSMITTIKDSLQLARDIAEIHERVVMRSPVEYREVINERVKHAAKNPDHVPSPRSRREGA